MRNVLIIALVATALLASVRGSGLMMDLGHEMEHAGCMDSVCLAAAAGTMTLDCLNHCLGQAAQQTTGTGVPMFTYVFITILFVSLFIGAAPGVRSVSNLGFDWIRKKDLHARIASVVLLN